MIVRPPYEGRSRRIGGLRCEPFRAGSRSWDLVAQGETINLFRLNL